MIPPETRRPTDVPDFIEAALPVFRSRRGAGALPKLAPPVRSNGFERAMRRAPFLLGAVVCGLGVLVGWMLSGVLR